MKTRAAPTVVMLIGSATHANIVKNGSFEESLISTNFVALSAGSTAIPGWTVTSPNTGRGVDVVNSTRYRSPNWSHTGVQSVDHAGSPGPGGVFQDLMTMAGQSYLLSFAVSSNGGPFTNALRVFWDGVELATLNSPRHGTWTVHAFSVTASGSSTRLSFSTNLSGNAGPLLDSVSVIPTPASTAVLAAACLVANRRRR